MPPIPVIAIFDVGKTNKKLLLFDEQYKLVHEQSKQFEEITDEDGFPCEDINILTEWIKTSFKNLLSDARFNIKGINFSGYGASFVYLNDKADVCLPLYNYLKPYPEKLKDKFYQEYGGESYISKATASPVLGSLNSGMQLYRLKNENPKVFNTIKHALHLPQYLSFILSGELCADITSIGCHTNLWEFQNNCYHSWVGNENILSKFPPLKSNDEAIAAINQNIPVGTGLHDSSAALIPYLISFNDPFVLISTGTWCITLNPFNYTQLSDFELHQDCLCYLSYQAKPVKASRLFAGYEHEQQTKLLAEHFKKPSDHYKTVQYNYRLIKKIRSLNKKQNNITSLKPQSVFTTRDLNKMTNYEMAYHQLISDIIDQQVHSIKLVLNTVVKRIVVDGGFSANSIYMNLLAEAFPDLEVYAATVPQASALGAALVLHKHWNTQSLPTDIIDLKLYSSQVSK